MSHRPVNINRMNTKPTKRKPSPRNEPTLVVPDDPMHLALAKAQAGMTTKQRLEFLNRMSGESTKAKKPSQ